MSAEDMDKPIVLGYVRDILQSDLGALDDLRIEADDIVLTFEGKTVRADIEESPEVCLRRAAKIATTLISRLNSDV